MLLFEQMMSSSFFVRGHPTLDEAVLGSGPINRREGTLWFGSTMQGWGVGVEFQIEKKTNKSQQSLFRALNYIVIRFAEHKPL